MPDTHTSFEDLPILTELRDELRRAYTARETTTATVRARRQRRAGRVGRRARPGVSKRPVALLGSGAGIVAVAVAAVVLGAGPAAQPAYALTENPDGSITVTINDVETAIPALNARFAAMGIDETVVPVEANCPPTTAFSGLFVYPQATTSETLTFTPGDKNLDPGYTGVIAAEQLSNGEVAIAAEAIKPPIPSCFPTTAYTMHRTRTTANGTPVYQFTPATTATTTTTSGS